MENTSTRKPKLTAATSPKPDNRSSAAQLDEHVAQHPAQSVRILHQIAASINRVADGLEGDLHPELIEMLDDAQQSVELVRDSVLHLS
jgi:hypothetical protein